MFDDEELRLIDKLQKIEALFARATSPGERHAAANARDRIRARLRELERTERLQEMRFTLPDEWSHRLFCALLRRYGVEPYRYPGQRRTTVMARITPSAHHMIWPEFLALHRTLRAHLHAVTRRIVERALQADSEDAAERPPAAE